MRSFVACDRKTNDNVASRSGEPLDFHTPRQQRHQIKPSPRLRPNVVGECGREIEASAAVDDVQYRFVPAKLERYAQRAGGVADRVADQLGENRSTRGDFGFGSRA